MQHAAIKDAQNAAIAQNDMTAQNAAIAQKMQNLQIAPADPYNSAPAQDQITYPNPSGANKFFVWL